MLKVRQELTAPTRTLRLASGDQIPAHRHDDHQIVYAGRGVLAVTTDRGSWVAPATRAIWIPAGTFHAHRAYGELKLHTVGLAAADNPLHLDSPTVLIVGPLLRELIIAYTASDDDTPERTRLRAVLLDQLRSSPQQPLHVPTPTAPLLAAVCDILQADPGDSRTLAELGRRGRRERSQSVAAVPSRPRNDVPAVAHPVASAPRAGPAGRANTGDNRGPPMRLVVGERVHRGVPAQLRPHPGRVDPAGQSRIRRQPQTNWAWWRATAAAPRPRRYEYRRTRPRRAASATRPVERGCRCRRCGSAGTSADGRRSLPANTPPGRSTRNASANSRSCNSSVGT